MWGHLIKLLSLGKGALVVGVAASAAMVSTAEISNTPSHNEQPTPTTPKTKPSTSGLEAAIQQCLKDWRNYAETSSAACAQALAASGLSTEDFWKKFEAWAVEQPYGDTTTDVDALVKECFAKYT